MRVAGNFQLVQRLHGAILQIDLSEAEAKANRGIDRVAMEEAVRQAAIDL
jgi:hypothetical protein